jgi:hypothetical protein
MTPARRRLAAVGSPDDIARAITRSCVRCYYHRDVEAIGTCRSCNRGLCDACLAEVGKACACRDRCEADVAVLHAILDRHDVAVASSARLLRVAALLCVLFAAVFVLLSRQVPSRVTLWLLLPAAFVLLLGAALLVFTARRYDAAARPPASRR